MEKSIEMWLSPILCAGCCLWCVYDVVRKFGWRGLLLKCSLIFNGLLLLIVIELGQMPWNAFRVHHHRVIDSGHLLSGELFCLVWYCVLVSDRAMRWLMKVPVQWTVHSGVAMWFVALYAGRKGWL